LAQMEQLQREKLELQRLLRIRELLQKARDEDGRGTEKKTGAGGRNNQGA
jgi:predicted 2-oxoglutarate/Fe(II)-dependent dioxygenase YbiX